MEARENESSAAIRAELISLLEAHGDELAEMLVTRYLGSGLGGDLDALSIAGVRLGTGEGVRVLQKRLGEGDLWSMELPPGIVVSIQYMVREGIPLDRVLRSFTLAITTIGEFVFERLDELERPEEVIRYLATMRSLNDDRLMATLTTEYEKEQERLDTAASRGLSQRIERLLEGGLGDFADLDYRLEGWHLGLIALGPRAELDCRRLAEMLGCELLVLPRPDDIVWAWLGAPRQISFAKLESAARGGSKAFAISAGEPRHGLDGWRLTHREARAGTIVGLLTTARVTRYSDVSLLASCLTDEVAARSLLDRYLTPLDRRRDGDVLRDTVRAYIDVKCNAASAAAALGVNRHTVQRRLRRIEESVGEPVTSRRAEFDVALRLQRMTATLARAAEGETVDQVVAMRIPPRTVLVHPEESRR